MYRQPPEGRRGPTALAANLNGPRTLMRLLLPHYWTEVRRSDAKADCPDIRALRTRRSTAGQVRPQLSHGLGEHVGQTELGLAEPALVRRHGQGQTDVTDESGHSSVGR